jgi:hypothetical protein
MVAMRIKGSTASKKAAVAVATDSSISMQIAAFLKEGGEIQKIPVGVSGQHQGSYFHSSNDAAKKTAAKKA